MQCKSYINKKIISYIGITILSVGITRISVSQAFIEKSNNTDSSSYFVCTPSDGVSIESIYNCLMENFSYYKDITFSTPSTNLLSTENNLWSPEADNSWFFQTPNIWGANIEKYNLMYKKNAGNIDPCLNLPLCNEASACAVDGAQYTPQCVTPIFLQTGPITSCPNKTLTQQNTKLCLTGAHLVMESLYKDIINAQNSIDMTSLNQSGKMLNGQVIDNKIGFLSPRNPPDPFFYLLKKSFEDLARTQRAVTIRILGGSPVEYDAAKNYLLLLTKDMPTPNNLTIYVAPEISCVGAYCPNPYVSAYMGSEVFETSWNHGKIVRVDQTALYYGGENLWGTDYLLTGTTKKSATGPVTDAMLRIQGPVVHDAYTYNNYMWEYINKNPSKLPSPITTSNYCYKYVGNKTGISYQSHCKAPYADTEMAQTPTGTGLSVNALSVAKLNGLIGTAPHGMNQKADKLADQSEPARVYAIQLANETIKIAQQSLFFSAKIKGLGYVWPADPGFKYPNPIDTLQAIAFALTKKNAPDVYILTTAPGVLGGYASMQDATYTYKFLCKLLVKTFHLSTQEATDKLNSKLNLGYVSYDKGDDQKSGFNGLPAHHNKFWMIDDKLFYYGSHNMYPAALQEFGVIIDNTYAAKKVLDTFWNHAWDYANRGDSVMPPSTKNCSNI